MVGRKLKVLGEAAKFDLCSTCDKDRRYPDQRGRWIYPAVLPDGERVFLLKVLMSNQCQNSCLYCVNRRGREKENLSFTSEELASLFWELYLQGKVKGLFLSSSTGEDLLKTLQSMLKTVEILRCKYRFRGYIHLKVLPDSPFSYVKEAVKLAHRVSINLEAPTPLHLSYIAPEKNWKEIMKRIRWISHLSKKYSLPGGQVTQFVVGPGGEKDRDILSLTWQLYQDFGVKRVYYSAFQPVPHTPLSGYPPTSLLREHRLYQADFLLRKYGFSFKDIFFDEEGNLPLNLDPKLLWAINHPEFFPIEVNQASYEDLLRVPGIGPSSALRILKRRKVSKFLSGEELKETGLWLERASPFILVNGKRIEKLREEQLPLITV